jgi:aspartyl-tRNA synthetase
VVRPHRVDVWRTPARRIAFGWDRTTGMDSICEVIAFPKTGGGVAPLTDTPAPVSARQRQASGIDAKRKQVDRA